jgi:hypothetical protein
LANVALLNGANSFSGNQTVFSGKVGIGTTSPGKLLQVGDGDPTNYTDGMIRLSCAASTWDIGVSVSNMLDFVINDATAGFTRFLIDHNGNVGIGTLPPANTLDVQGSADFYGKVGIGTLTPANTLDVQGSADFSGNVGIGTTNPTKGSLEIDLQHGVIQGYTPVGLLTTSGATRGDFLFTTAPISIWAAGDVLSAEFVAFSDERIKNIKGQSDRAADLQTLLGIKVTDFTYKDTVSKGNRPQKKVIAQQVEQVFPQAVSKSTDVVPDIYRKATLKDGWVQLTTDLKVGDRVKLIGEKEKGVYTVLEVRNGAFRTDFKPSTEQVFVYGREVKDFRNVDYEAIAMLNVSATQELAHKVTKLESSLNQALAEKETLLKRLSVLEERDQAREDRLARMESALEKDSAGVSYVSLKRR